MDNRTLEEMRNKVRMADEINNERAVNDSLMTALEGKRKLLLNQPSTTLSVDAVKISGKVALTVIDVILEKLNERETELIEAFKEL